MSTLKQQGTSAFLWDFSGKLALQGTGFVISVFLARLLEPSEFGLIAMVMVIMGIAGIFVDVGLGGALVQRKRVLTVHYNSVFYFNVVVASLLSVLTYLSAPLIADFYGNPELVLLTQVLSVMFVLGSVNGVHVVQFQKALNFKTLTRINVTASVLGGVVGVVLAFRGVGVWSLVAQQLISSIISGILLWSASPWRPSLVFSFKALFGLWGFGFRMFLSGFLAMVSERLDVMIIGKLFPAATLGFFQRAKALDQLVISYTSGSLMSVLFPLLSKVKNDLPRFQNIIIKSLGIICFVTFFLLGVLYLVSEELIVMLFTAKWLPSVELFQILVLSGFAYPVSALLVNVLSSRGNSKAFLRLEIYKRILGIGSFVVLYFWGIQTYLYGLIIFSSLSLTLNILFTSREIKLPFMIFIKPMFVQMSIAISAVVLTLLATKNLPHINILMFTVKVILFALIYITINHMFKTKSYIFSFSEIKPIINNVLKGKK